MDPHTLSVIRSLFGETLVSCYRNARDAAGRPIYLSSFLTSQRHRVEVETVRRMVAEGEKKRVISDYKADRLPACTPSGWFVPSRSKENLKRHSGFLCLDFDAADNEGVTVDDMYDCLSAQPEVAYASLSCSGRGMYALVPVAMSAGETSATEHPLLFRALMDHYNAIGLHPDRACSDVCRPRFVSVDDAPYVNPQPVVWDRLYVEPIAQRNTYRQLGIYSCREDYRQRVKLASCLEIIERYRIDIVPDYEHWYRMAMALREFGEEGRTAFHTISSVSPAYSSAECERKWRQCQQSGTGGTITAATFFERCLSFGIRYADAEAWSEAFPK